MSNDLKSNGEHAGGANNDFPKFAPGDNADKVLSASYQNKLIAGVERANRKTYGSGVIDFGPVSLQKGQRRAPESGNRIRVRLDYPYRAPMGAVVGVDFPILDEAIEDQYDLVNFLNDPVTTYSCSKNQYRHHNRIAILEQELLPGQTGWAVISGVAKTFWHAQRPLYSSQEPTPSDTAAMLPIQSTNSQSDDYRHLGILAAEYNSTPFSIAFGGHGSEHFTYTPISGAIHWFNRERPWWLCPLPRVEYDHNDQGANANYELSYPYSNDAENTDVDINISASSRGRAMGLHGDVVPEPACTGSSSVKCIGRKWSVVSSTCSTGCSSWHVIEGYISSRSNGLDLPCAEGSVVNDIPCGSDFPVNDFDTGSENSFPSGVWARGESNGDVKNWIVGSAILGTPEAPAIKDAEEPSGESIGAFLSPRDFPDPYGSLDSTQWGVVLRACANLTCTYKCNGSSWVRERGQSPYNLDEHWRCKCPDDWMATMAGADLPCNATSQPREFTVGMIYDSVNTTTTTTSSSTTTTAATGACCYTLSTPGFGMDCVDGTTLSGCDALSGSWTEGATCSSIGSSCHLGACCRAVSPSSECSLETEYDCQRNSTGDYEFMGVGTTCEGVSCQGGACCNQETGGCGYSFQATCDGLGAPWTYLGDGVGCGSCSATTTTTSSTTTTTGTSSTTTSSTTTTTGTSSTTTSSTTTTTGTSSTTTSSTTTTTAATGACCISNIEGGFTCAVETQSDCESGHPGGATYQGDGTTCSPDPCGGGSSTTSSTTTTSSGGSTTSSTTTTTAQNIGACCYSTSACANVASMEDCANIYNGTYAGDGTTCQDTPNPCGY